MFVCVCEYSGRVINVERALNVKSKQKSQKIKATVNPNPMEEPIDKEHGKKRKLPETNDLHAAVKKVKKERNGKEEGGSKKEVGLAATLSSLFPSYAKRNVDK